MSNRTLMIAIVVALALGVIALFVLRSGRIPVERSSIVPAGERLMELDPAAVRAIEVRAAPDRNVTRLERDTGSDEWRMTFGNATGSGPSPSWRVEPNRVRDLLRVLSTVTAVGTADPAAALGDNPVTARFELQPAGEITLRLTARVLGGQGLVEITSPPANVPRAAAASAPASGSAAPADQTVTRQAVIAATIHALFQPEALRTWRDRSIFPGALAETSRVRLVARALAPSAEATPPGERVIALSKVQGQWAVIEPLAAPAEPAAVQALLTALESLSVAKFHDERPAASATGLEQPVARVVLESDRAPSREMVIGAPADAPGRLRFASTDDAATVISVESQPLAQLQTDPTLYIRRAASAVAAPDIGLLMFVATTPDGSSIPGRTGPSMGFLRRIDGWVELRPDGTQVLQDPTRSDAINAFLRFVSSEPAAAVSLSPPTGYQTIGALDLRTAGDQPLDRMEIGRFAATGVAIRRGDVYRTYGTIPDLLKAALGPIEPNPGVAPEGAEPRDITK
ncbi:MAG: DUF4340 domain-containing protein [Phycisphaerales bacterium]